MRLTWRRQPSETGLSSIGQGPRGAILKVNGEDVGSVNARRIGLRFEWSGWYWSARIGDVVGNSAADGRYYGDLDEAKRDCAAWVLRQLEAQKDGAPT